MRNSIKLQTEAVLQLPLQKYMNDFTFIVNSEKYETSSIVADLLSPIISSQHLIDPTIKEFNIITKTRGDFKKIVELTNFEEQDLREEDFSFIIEVFDQLGIEKVTINHKNDNIEITNDNIFELIKKHQIHPKFYGYRIEQEIEYFASHFSELKDNLLKMINESEEEKEKEEEIENYVIELIICNNNLQLESEDELLKMINELYKKNRKYSKFYEYVDFINVEVESMNEFVEIFDMNDLTKSIWSSIVSRLEQRIYNENTKHKHKHEITKKQNKEKVFLEIENKENEFDGLLNYLQTHSNIKDEINITASSYNDGDTFNLLQYENIDNYFCTNYKQNSWICFEFKKHQIIPSNYIIRTFNSENHWHLKTWILEGSNDNKSWITLKGQSKVHSFPISKQEQSFKYLRISQTGANWYNNNDSSHNLIMNSIEFYGKLI